MADAQSKISLIIGAEDEASSKLQSISENAQKMGAAFTVVGGAIVGALGVAVKSYDDHLKVQAQMEAVLKSTHGAAGLFIEDLNDQASALQKLTTYSDESINSAQNLLLTFTNIKGPIFQEATNVVLDMSTALGQDLKSSSIQLGKALNDPIKGITALSRVGVSFTEEQKNVIEQLVKTGQTAKAQQVILKELNTEFGGSAKAEMQTFGGQLTNLRNQFDEIMETVGSKVLPILSKFVNDYIKPIVEKLQAWIEKNPELTTKILLVVGALGAFLAVVGPLLIAAGALTAAITAIGVAGFITMGWILLIIAAIVAVGVAVYELIKHWDTVKAKTLEIWGSILDFFKSIWDSIKNAFYEALTAIKDFFVSSWQWVYDHTIGIWNGLSDSAKGWIKLLFVILTLGLGEIIFLVVNNWQQIADATQKVWDAIALALQVSWKFISDIAVKIWTPIKQFFSDIMNAVRKVFGDVWNDVKDDASKVWEGIKQVVGSAVEWINQQIQKVIDAYNKMKSLVAAPVQAVGNTFSNIGSSLNNFFSGRAGGGNVDAGTTYLVGERGPELFTPGISGGINPKLSAAGGGGITINISGNTLLDEFSAEKIGDMILDKLKFKSKF